MGQLLRQTLFASYNGFQFNNSTKTTALRIDPVVSADGRTVLYNRWTVGLKFEIATSVGTTDAVVQAAIVALSHAGAPFIYRGRGLGNPDVNTGSVRDLKFGPIPKVLSVDIIGPGNAVEISWQVEFHLPNCNAALNPFGIMEFSCAVTHEIDDAGYTTRSVSGYIEVINNRKNPGERRVITSADGYRELVLLPLPEGFKRKGMRFTVAPSLSHLDFSWTDEEMPVVLPEGIVEASLRDSINSQAAGLVMWGGTVSGTYRMARGYTWHTAAAAFFEAVWAIINDRRRRLGSAGQKKPPPPNGLGGILQAFDVGDKTKTPKNTTPIPTAFSMENPDRYGKPAASFSLSYKFACPLRDLLAATGMHLPIEHNYRLWAASLSDSALNPYGGANLIWATGDEPGIVDACGATVPGELRTGDVPGAWFPPSIPLPTRFLKPPEAPVNSAVSEMVSGAFPKPTAEDSFVEWENEIFLESNTGTLHVKKLPTMVPDPENGVFGDNGLAPASGDAMAAKDFKSFAPPWFQPNFGGRLEPTYIPEGIMRRTAESAVIFMRGWAARVGHPVAPPRLVAVNGVPAVQLCRPDRGEGFGVGIKGNAVNTVHYGYWNLRYVLSIVPPGPLPIPPNPMLEDKK